MQLLRISGIMALCLLMIAGCGNRYATPKGYIYLNQGDGATRLRDSLELLDGVRYLIDHREEAFYPEFYDQDTDFRIHSIFYSPDQDRFAVFVVTKTPSNQDLQLQEDQGQPEYHFYATLFLGKKDPADKTPKITWFPLVNVQSPGGFEETAHLAQNLAFHNLAGMKDSDGSRRFWNLNDARFWEDHLWEEFF